MFNGDVFGGSWLIFAGDVEGTKRGIFVLFDGKKGSKVVFSRFLDRFFFPGDIGTSEIEISVSLDVKKDDSCCSWFIFVRLFFAGDVGTPERDTTSLFPWMRRKKDPLGNLSSFFESS